MKTRKHICILSSFVLPVPAVKGGAVETLITNLADENEQYQELEITIFSIYDKQAQEFSQRYKHTHFVFIKKTWWDKICTFIYKVVHRLTGKSCNFLASMERKAWHIICAKQFDQIIFEGGKVHYAKHYLAFYRKEQIFYHQHCVLTRLPDHLYQSVGTVICISDFIKKQWLTLPVNKQPSNVVTLLNGIDLSLFQKVRKSVSNKDFTFFYCGRMVKAKGVLELLQAFVAARLPHSQLVLAGSITPGGEIRAAYIKRLKEGAQNHPNIRFLGAVKYHDLPKYYTQANYTVVPTLVEEGAGLVVVESLASGTPVIITQSGGMPEYVTTKVSIKVDKKNQIVDHLKEALSLAYYQKTISPQICRQAAQRFSKQNYYKNYVNILNS